MQRTTNEILAAAENHIGVNRHWFDKVDPVEADPAKFDNELGTLFELGSDQSFTLPEMYDMAASDDCEPIVLKGPGFIQLGSMGDRLGAPDTWYRVYFIQGVDEYGETVAYELSAT